MYIVREDSNDGDVIKPVTNRVNRTYQQYTRIGDKVRVIYKTGNRFKCISNVDNLSGVKNKNYNNAI